MVAYGIDVRDAGFDEGDNGAPRLGAVLTCAFAAGDSNSAPVRARVVATADTLTAEWPGDAAYNVVVHPRPFASVQLFGATERDAALALILSVLPLSLPLFGLEPLHGSAVAFGEGALLALGHPGAGKSTLAAEWERRGARFLADDACAFDEDGRLWPGPPLRSTRIPGATDLAVAGYDGKTVVRSQRHASTPVEPAALLVLRPATRSALSVTQLDSRNGLEAVLEHVRAPHVLPAQRQRPQLALASRLVSGVPVFRIGFDPASHSAASVVEALEEGPLRSRLG